MKKLFYLLMVAIAVPLMFMQCSSDDNEGGKEPAPDPIGGDELIDPEDLSTFREIASFDTTFTFQPPAAQMSCTVNFSDKWDNEECFLIKLSKREQKELLDKASDKYGKETPLYISDVHCWPADDARLAAIVIKGSADDFETVAEGQFTNVDVKGTDWARRILSLDEKAVRITATEDLFVGIHAKGIAPNTYVPTCIHSDSRFPGLDAQYPSYAYCPNTELHLQEINGDDKDMWNWDPGMGTINFSLKVRICTLKEYN